jgi:hypothetical protein
VSSGWSISDLFDEARETGEVNEAPFDAANFDKVLDQVIAERPVAGRPAGMDEAGSIPEPPPEPDIPTEPAPEPSDETPAPSETPPAAPADPFAALDPLERQELLLLREAMRDPDRQVAIRRAYLGVADATAPAAVELSRESTPPAPILPEHIDPDSFEAQLWHAQQETNRQLSELRAGLAQANQQSETQLAQAAAQRATQAFVAKYGDRLERTDIEWVAQTAGMQGLPAAFASTGLSLDDAMTRSLEYTLRSSDTLLAKVLGGGSAPTAAPPSSPTAAEADLRKRQLSALSSAAAPAGEAPIAPPIQHREDGKLTEESRLALIRQMTGGGVMGELMGPS